MPKIRLTKTSIESLPHVPGKQIDYLDTRITGFGCRVSSYTKTYIVTGRVNGKQFRESIGKVDAVPFHKAEEKARKILEDAALGISPGDRRKEKEHADKEVARHAQAEEQKNKTVDDIFKAYVSMKKNLKKNTASHYELLINAHLADWKDRPVREITGEMVIKRHALIGKKSPAVADTTMRVLRALMNFAIDAYDDMLIKNPVKKLSALGAWYKVGRKDTFIAAKDLKKWFEGVMGLDTMDGRDILRLLIFTGARKDEAGSLQWKDIDFTAGTVTFRKTKRGSPLEVPACAYILNILRERSTLYNDGPESFVFPSYGKDGYRKDIRHPCQVVAQASGVNFTPHDLRRSFISYCETLRIPVFTIKRLVNHALPKDVTQGYVQFHVEDLRRDVESVAAYILRNAGAEEGKVIQMRKAE